MYGDNGCFCGARRVVEFIVEDKSSKEIGIDLGGRWYKHRNGIKGANGSIYCVPDEAEYLLKIIPGEEHNAEVKIVEKFQLPKGEREAGVLANDSCIYYLPFARTGCILNLDPND